MSKSNFSEDFKRDAVRQITERGYPAAEVSPRLGVSQHSLSLTFGNQAQNSAQLPASARLSTAYGGHHPSATQRIASA